MRLRAFEQTAAYHAKAADLAFTNGNVETAISHLEAAFYAATNNRSKYLSVVSHSLIERYDEQYVHASKVAILNA